MRTASEGVGKLLEESQNADYCDGWGGHKFQCALRNRHFITVDVAMKFTADELYACNVVLYAV